MRSGVGIGNSAEGRGFNEVILERGRQYGSDTRYLYTVQGLDTKGRSFPI
jgi:hypothetical protein